MVNKIVYCKLFQDNNREDHCDKSRRNIRKVIIMPKNMNYNKEQLKTKLPPLNTFFSEVISSKLDMSKTEYKTPEGVYRYCKYLEKILKYTDKNAVSEQYATRKTIEEYAAGVDCLIFEVFHKYPEIRYSKCMQELLEDWKENTYHLKGVSSSGHIIGIYPDSKYDIKDRKRIKDKPEQITLYACFRHIYFDILDRFREDYGNDWSKGSAEKIREQTDLLQYDPTFFEAYKQLLSGVIRVLNDFMDHDEETLDFVGKILEKYHFDEMMKPDRSIYKKNYEHFGIDGVGFLTLEDPEQIFTFEMWDAEEITEVNLTVKNNDFFHEENGKYYSNLFQFKMIDFDPTEKWSEYRGEYVKTIHVKAVRNYTEKMVDAWDMQPVTFVFETNCRAKSNVNVDVAVVNLDLGYDKIMEEMEELDKDWEEYAKGTQKEEQQK